MLAFEILKLMEVCFKSFLQTNFLQVVVWKMNNLWKVHWDANFLFSLWTIWDCQIAFTNYWVKKCLLPNHSHVWLFFVVQTMRQKMFDLVLQNFPKLCRLLFIWKTIHSQTRLILAGCLSAKLTENTQRRFLNIYVYCIYTIIHIHKDKL